MEAQVTGGPETGPAPRLPEIIRISPHDYRAVEHDLLAANVQFHEENSTRLHSRRAATLQERICTFRDPAAL